MSCESEAGRIEIDGIDEWYCIVHNILLNRRRAPAVCILHIKKPYIKTCRRNAAETRLLTGECTLGVKALERNVALEEATRMARSSSNVECSKKIEAASRYECRGIRVASYMCRQNAQKRSVGRRAHQMDTGPHRISKAEQECTLGLGVGGVASQKWSVCT